MAAGAAGEQDRLERDDAVLVRCIESDLELGHSAGLGREPLLLGDLADLLRQVKVLLVTHKPSSCQRLPAGEAAPQLAVLHRLATANSTKAHSAESAGSVVRIV